jgi:NADPH:quinone reductase-like Zn-dependent oxidoreductase
MGLRMKAVVFDQYGPPEVLRYCEVERPSPRKGEVLVRVRAVSLNQSDWEILRGTPAYVRIFGLREPRIRILGSDVTGIVEAVGSGVTKFIPGDEVYGDTMGTFGGFAEYAVIREKMLLKKPPTLSFEEVATVPQAGIIAVQGLRYGTGVKPGDHVLINGGGGGSGMFAIQLAKQLGALVTAVDNEKKQDHMRALGADHVIDYRRVDFAEAGERYDHILDLVGTRSPFVLRKALRPGGRYALVGGEMSSFLSVLFWGPLLGALSARKMGILSAEANEADLVSLLQGLTEARLRVTIDRIFPLEDTAAALRYLGEGRVLGKVLVVPPS